MSTNNEIELSIRLFGAFRKFHNMPIAITITKGSNVAAVKAALHQELKRINQGFSEEELLAKSVLATDTAVLDSGTCLMQSTQLALLPPVCGG